MKTNQPIPIILFVAFAGVTHARGASLAKAHWGTSTEQYAGYRDSVFDGFKEWVETYLAESSSDARAELESTGTKLAMKRSEIMLELIRLDPASALRRAIDNGVKKRLPDSVSRYLENPITGWGRFVVSHGCGPNGCDTLRQVVYQGKMYEAFVYGGGVEQTTRENIWINGIAIGSCMAINENCLSDKRIADASASASPDRSLRRPWTTGTKTVLYMRLDYPDAPGATLGMEAAQFLMIDVGTFYFSNTYGKIPSMPATVTPVLRMPSPYGSYTSREEVEADAIVVGQASGFLQDAYDLVVYQNTPVQVMSGKWGWARENARGVWMYNGFNWMHHSHEFGHNFGNRHANLWDTYGNNPIGPGENLEYGDVFDNMGNRGDLGEGHHNPWFKNRQDWLDDADIKTVTTSGIFRVQAIEAPPDGDWMALRIPRDSTRNYWVFYRNQFPTSRNGAIVIWGYNSRVSSHLIDMTPGTASGMNDAWDAPLLVGQTFDDPIANIQVTVLGKGDTIPETLNIEVTRGAPLNVAPTVDAGPNQVIVLSSTSVTANLDGTVIDPDDTLVTTWAAEGPVTFGNPNAVDTTATFEQTGEYFLVLRADDGVNFVASDRVDIQVVSPGGEGLLLVSPQGGETWPTGGPATVTWSSAGVANVKIELSRDGGWTWETLTGSTAASAGSWTWSGVSVPESNRCLVRVSDAADGVPTSQSSDFLAIALSACIPSVSGDFDCDGDVDLDDFSIFAFCIGGPGVTAVPPGCNSTDFANTDLDGDNDVDLADFSVFQGVFPSP